MKTLSDRVCWNCRLAPAAFLNKYLTEDGDQVVTEAEWSVCADPRPMLDQVAQTLSRRKLLLFAAACGRRLGSQFAYAPTLRLIETVEQFVDGLVAINTLEETLAAAPPPEPRGTSPEWGRWELATQYSRSEGMLAAADLIRAAIGLTRGRIPATTPPGLPGPQHRKLLKALRGVWNRIARRTEGPRTMLSFEHAQEKERAQQAALLRDLLGSPYRPVCIHPTCLVWHDGTIRKIAQSIYEGHRFEDMPILADALEDAGCDNEEVLRHCRQRDDHVRGCWVIDALLGKN